MIQKIKKISVTILLFAASLAFFATIYTIHIWSDIYFEQILIALENGGHGAGHNIITSYIYFALIPAVVLTLITFMLNVSNRLLLSVSVIFLFFSCFRQFL